MEDYESRLIIKNIENVNFKSFAGKVMLGPFNKSFTSIVGPNGSGKSNVIDSILFVFGYRSSKIRSKKLSSLIHKSEKNTNFENCIVTIFFNIINKNDDIMDEFSISRKAFSDNTSVYYYKDKKLNYNEIKSLLKSYNIDVEYNRFLILQGEVEQISLMKPKSINDNEDGMLEYLEEIIGTKEYIEPINEKKRLIEELNDLRSEKYNRVKIIQQEKDILQPARNEALLYLEQEKKKTILKYSLINYKKNNILKHNEELFTKKLQLEKSIEKISAEKETLEIQLNEYNKINQNIIKKILPPLNKKLENKNEQLLSLEKNTIKQKQDTKFITKKIDDIQLQLCDQNSKKKQLSSSILTLKNSLSELQNSKNSLQTEKDELQIVIDKLMIQVKKETDGLVKKKSEIDETLFKEKEKLTLIKTEIDKIKNELAIVMLSKKQLEDQIKTIQNDIKNTKLQITDKKQMVDSYSEKIITDKDRVNRIAKNILKIEKELDEKKKLYQDQCSLFDNYNQINKNSNQKSKILTALIDAQKKGQISGLLGKLGDLGAIDAKYDCAASSAFNVLDHILVETQESAVKCIDFIRKNKIGVATFINLEKMKVWGKRLAESRNNLKIPNKATRMIDLVEIKEKRFESAFYFAMRDTLVCDDVDQASQIAFDDGTRWRVVTLNGEVIEKSGTSTGGGSYKSKGKLRLISASKSYFNDSFNINDIEKKMNNLKNDVDNLKIEYNEELKTKNQISTECQKIEKDIKKLEMEIESLETNLLRLEKELEGFTDELSNIKIDQNKAEILESDIVKKDKNYQDQNKKVTKITNDSEKVSNEISKVTLEITHGEEMKLNSVHRIIDQVEEELSKNLALVNNNQKQIQKVEQNMLSLEQDLKKQNQKLEKIQQQVASQNMINEQDLKNEIQEIQQEIDENKLKLNECSNVEVIKSLEAVKMKFVDINSELTNIAGSCQGTLRKIEQLEIELIEQRESLGEETFEIIEIIDYDTEIKNLENLEETLKAQQINLNVIKEYEGKLQIYEERLAELEEITNQRDEHRKEMENLNKERLTRFIEGFTIINTHLKELYQLITLGGSAELEFVDSLDPFVEGIVFSVRPPNKSWKIIANLSGGEKTLSSLSLVFALHCYKPSPFYVMDEIDAALDFKNVSIIANYIKEKTKNAQFIIISLRTNMFELANLLVGIYKTDNSTKTVLLIPDKIE